MNFVAFSGGNTPGNRDLSFDPDGKICSDQFIVVCANVTSVQAFNVEDYDTQLSFLTKGLVGIFVIYLFYMRDQLSNIFFHIQIVGDLLSLFLVPMTD